MKLIKLEDAIEAYNQAVTLLVESEMEEFNLGDFTECSFNTTQIKLIARMIESLPTIEVSEDMVSRKDFEDVIRRMGERNCFTCGVYCEGEWVLMGRNPEEVTAEELEENDRAVSLAEVCKIIQEAYEVCPATWGRLRNLPSVIPKPKEGEWIRQGISPHEGIQKCSVCGALYDIAAEFDNCPNCGAKMKR